MAKSELQKIITANDLLGGHVVYFDGVRWARNFSAAQRFTPEQARRALEQISPQDAGLVGIYLADVTALGQPTHFREDFRANGPSTRSVTAQNIPAQHHAA